MPDMEHGEVVWLQCNGEDVRAVLTDLPAGTFVKVEELGSPETFELPEFKPLRGFTFPDSGWPMGR